MSRVCDVTGRKPMVWKQC